jgi:hypothetical protein
LKDAEKKSNPADIAKPYEPTPSERETLKSYFARRDKRKPAPRMKVKADAKGVVNVEFHHPDRSIGQWLLMDAIGTADSEFMDGLLKQLVNAGTQGRTVDENGLNFMLSIVKGIEPRDQVETMLAAQMAAVHNATMTFARRLAHVDNIPQQDSVERAFNKLARTFATQVEALKRYRTGGEQTIRVEHVTVNEGGQAIVGTVTHGGRDNDENRGQPHAPENAGAITFAPGTPLPSADEARDAMPVASGRR